MNTISFLNRKSSNSFTLFYVQIKMTNISPDPVDRITSFENKTILLYSQIIIQDPKYEINYV